MYKKRLAWKHAKVQNFKRLELFPFYGTRYSFNLALYLKERCIIARAYTRRKTVSMTTESRRGSIENELQQYWFWPRRRMLVEAELLFKTPPAAFSAGLTLVCNVEAAFSFGLSKTSSFQTSAWARYHGKYKFLNIIMEQI